MSSRWTASSTFSPGYLGITGGPGDHSGAGGGIAIIPSSTTAVRGGGTAAIGTRIPCSNCLVGRWDLDSLVEESQLLSVVGFLCLPR